MTRSSRNRFIVLVFSDLNFFDSLRNLYIDCKGNYIFSNSQETALFFVIFLIPPFVYHHLTPLKKHITKSYPVPVFFDVG